MFSGGSSLLKIIKNEQVVERKAKAPDNASAAAPASNVYAHSFDDGLKQGREEGRKAGLAEGIAQGRQAGIAEGRAAGIKEGEVKSRAALAEQFKILSRISSELDSARNTMVKDAEQEVLKLSLMVAEKVIRTHLEQDENLSEFVRKLLAVVTDKARVVVRVSSEDAEVLRAVSSSLASDTNAGLSIIGDDRLVRGDCVVETNSGNFDARVSSQMSEIRRQLTNGGAEGK